MISTFMILKTKTLSYRYKINSIISILHHKQQFHSVTNCRIVNKILTIIWIIIIINIRQKLDQEKERISQVARKRKI